MKLRIVCPANCQPVLGSKKKHCVASALGLENLAGICNRVQQVFGLRPMLSHHLIWHGRRVCHARNPACGACPVARWCPAYGEGPTDPAKAAKLVKTEGPA